MTLILNLFATIMTGILRDKTIQHPQTKKKPHDEQNYPLIIVLKVCTQRFYPTNKIT